MWEVRDALDELVQVAAYGWPGYVDATLAADAHRRWRVRLWWWCVVVVVVASWRCVG